jgi:hypothetical protein
MQNLDKLLCDVGGIVHSLKIEDAKEERE